MKLARKAEYLFNILKSNIKIIILDATTPYVQEVRPNISLSHSITLTTTKLIDLYLQGILTTGIVFATDVNKNNPNLQPKA